MIKSETTTTFRKWRIFQAHGLDGEAESTLWVCEAKQGRRFWGVNFKIQMEPNKKETMNMIFENI